MRTCLALVLLLAAQLPAQAQSTDEAGTEALVEAAEQAENPIPNIVLVRLENGTSYLIGPNERSQNVLVLQPSVPISIGPDLTLSPVPRIPFVWQPDASAPAGEHFGMGDITLNLFLGPAMKPHLTWGIGPTFRFPTATDHRLGAFDSGKVSIGPTAVAVVTTGPFVIGASVSNVWSVAGRGDERVNAFVLQPNLNYNFRSAWHLTSSPFILADWSAADARWLVPVGGGVGRVALLSPKVALNLEAHAYWNAIRPAPGPVWSLRFQATVTFPD